jgi:hypothetical protein
MTRLPPAEPRSMKIDAVDPGNYAPYNEMVA